MQSSPEAMRQLESDDWPGVPSWKQHMERAVAWSAVEIPFPGLHTALRILARCAPLPQVGRLNIPPRCRFFRERMADAETRYFKAALEKADGVRTRADRGPQITTVRLGHTQDSKTFGQISDELLSDRRQNCRQEEAGMKCGCLSAQFRVPVPRKLSKHSSYVKRTNTILRVFGVV